MKIVALKKVEKGILSYLDIDSRTSFSRIGKKIRKSQQQVSYTVQSLKDKEILKGFYTLMDYSKINYNLILFRVYFKVIYTKEQTYENLIEFDLFELFLARPNVMMLASSVK